MDTLTKIAVVISNIGAINWGLATIGSGKFELIQYLQLNWLITTVYAIVGLAGLYCLVKFFTKK